MNDARQLESEVRYYARTFPDVFVSAKGARLRGRSGRAYIDFFAGAGTLNYGHNDPAMKRCLIEYLSGDGIVQSLDMASEAKEAFMSAFHDVVLAPRGMDHRMLFPGPAGANAVEAALKLARKATGRKTVVSFLNAFHGMSMGALAVSRKPSIPSDPHPPMGGTVFMPYDDTVDALESLFASDNDKPAACIVETVQAEGGVVAASADWLRRLREICTQTGVVLIVDDIQVGCGRTGPFFSFETAGIVPDIVCLSKSLSGMGLPLALVLVRPPFDKLSPGEHSGTFRGFAPAFITATEALRFWRDDALEKRTAVMAAMLRGELERIAAQHLGVICGPVRGRGLIQGLETHSGEVARRIAAAAFARGLLIETAGPDGEVLKVLCPLTISEEDMHAGLAILDGAVGDVD